VLPDFASNFACLAGPRSVGYGPISPVWKRAGFSWNNFISGNEIDRGGLSAAATLITLPIQLLIVFVQRHIVQGMTVGGLKE
jgi:hypothetical protein